MSLHYCERLSLERVFRYFYLPPARARKLLILSWLLLPSSPPSGLVPSFFSERKGGSEINCRRCEDWCLLARGDARSIDSWRSIYASRRVYAVNITFVRFF